MQDGRQTKSRQSIDLDRVAFGYLVTQCRANLGSWFGELSPREREVLAALWRSMPSTRRHLQEHLAEADFLAGRTRETAMRAWDRAVDRLPPDARTRVRGRGRPLGRGVGRPVDPLARARVALQDVGLTSTEIATLLQLCGTYAEAVPGSDRARTQKSIERAKARDGRVCAPVVSIRAAIAAPRARATVVRAAAL